VFGLKPVLLAEVPVTVPTLVKGPLELKLRCTWYCVAPETGDQLIVILVDDPADAETPVGTPGIEGPAAFVLAETAVDKALVPALFVADTL
jgi:hypothetical protein